MSAKVSFFFVLSAVAIWGSCADQRKKNVPCVWSPWMNRDRPGGSGDWETVADLYREGRRGSCPAPAELEARRVADKAHYASTGEANFKSAAGGFYCRNKDQEDDRMCDDYEVRMCCDPCSCCGEDPPAGFCRTIKVDCAACPDPWQDCPVPEPDPQDCRCVCCRGCPGQVPEYCHVLGMPDPEFCAKLGCPMTRQMCLRG